MFTLILGLLVAISALVFAFQNTELIQVKFLIYQFEGSLALVLIGALLTGFIVALFVLMPVMLNRSKKNKRQDAEYKAQKENEDSMGIQYETEGFGESGEDIPTKINNK